jgi:HPt (histidine-containing phosphotransfer) domain-containing protein
MNDAVVSTLGDDPDLGELVDEYVAVLEARIIAIERAAAAGDRRQAEILAHQMVGGAGSLGFAPISEAARRVEELARDGTAPALTAGVGVLAALCRRARAR